MHIRGAIGYFKAITRHRRAVIANCFRAGIGRQELRQDLKQHHRGVDAELLTSGRLKEIDNHCIGCG